MAGAMRRMGIYLGLVEDDDRGYGRYDARQGEYGEHPDDRRTGRYLPEDSYDDRYDEGYPAPAYPAGGYADDEPAAERPVPVREAEPLAVRRVTPARPAGPG